MVSSRASFWIPIAHTRTVLGTTRKVSSNASSQHEPIGCRDDSPGVWVEATTTKGAGKLCAPQLRRPLSAGP